MQHIAPAIFLAVLSFSATAGVCDHRPSHALGSLKAKIVTYGSGAAAVAGAGLKAAGFYTAVNATTGATMLGSTAAGASAAGTTGFIAGTGAGIGAVAAALMSPVVIGSAAVVAVAAGGYEGVCAAID